MSTIVYTGDQIEKDPRDWMILDFNWEPDLPNGVDLVDEGEMTVSNLTNPLEDPVNLVLDEQDFISGSTKKVQFRIKDGTLGCIYNIAHFVTWDTDPEQKREKSVNVLIREQ